MGNPVVYFEVGCRDSRKTQDFYSKLFEWKIEEAGPAAMKMRAVRGHITGLLLMLSRLIVVICFAQFLRGNGHAPNEGISSSAESDPLGSASASRQNLKPPKLPAEMERLKFYVGDWDYTEDYPKSTLFPNGGYNTGYWTAQFGPRGQCIVNTFASHGSGDNYEGMEIMAWDPKEGLYRNHSLWFDSPDQWSYTGRFEGEVLIYHAEFDFLGKHVRFRSETRPQSGGGFTLDEFASVNGDPEEALLHGRARPH